MDEDEQKRIDAGSRVAQFLADDAVRDALDRLNKRYYTAFKVAASRDERDAAWAQARVLDDFANELAAVIDAGKRANADRQRRARGPRTT